MLLNRAEATAVPLANRMAADMRCAVDVLAQDPLLWRRRPIDRWDRCTAVVRARASVRAIKPHHDMHMVRAEAKFT